MSIVLERMHSQATAEAERRRYIEAQKLVDYRGGPGGLPLRPGPRARVPGRAHRWSILAVVLSPSLPPAHVPA